MDFREYIEDQEVDFLLWPVVSRIKQYVLSNLRVNNGSLEISFPKEQTNQLRLVAHTEPDGDLVEGYNQQHPYGKAGLAFKAIDQSTFAKSMSKRDAYDFQRGLKPAIEKISKYMGSIFEIEIFLYMVDDKKMTVRGRYDKSWALHKLQVMHDHIVHETNQRLANMVRGFINHHVEDLGEKIHQKAVSLLDCTVDTVIFTGGDYEDRGFITQHLNRNTADITLSCGKAKTGRRALGFSTKFTSETSVAIATLFPKQAYVLTGGKDVLSFEREYESTNGPYKDSLLVKRIAENLRQISTSPSKIDWLVNYLVFGSEKDGGEETVADTLPAYRNYVRNKGGAGFGDAIRGDFHASELPGEKLRMKRNADVDVNETDRSVTLKVSGPSSRGTLLKFIVFQGMVKVSMNNLAA